MMLEKKKVEQQKVVFSDVKLKLVNEENLDDNLIPSGWYKSELSTIIIKTEIKICFAPKAWRSSLIITKLLYDIIHDPDPRGTGLKLRPKRVKVITV